MRIWDVDPRQLARQHLGGEWNELHQMLRALVALDQGVKAGWQSHPDTQRFVGREWMLLGRRHWLQYAAKLRGYNYAVVPDVPGLWWGRLGAHADPAEHDDWRGWADAAAWPWGPVSDDGTPENHSGVDPYGPWHRDGVSYPFYRLEGQYADGILDFSVAP